MLPQNPILTSSEEQFVVGESDFAFYSNYAGRCESGAILFCRAGSAQVTVDQFRGTVCRDTLILVLPGWILMFTDRTDDFRVSYFAFSQNLFSEAAFRLDPPFFQAMHEYPVTHPTQRIAEGASIWFQMVTYTYRDKENIFRNTIIKNRLQNVLLEAYDKLQRDTAKNALKIENTTRQMELFHRFVMLIQESSARERDVAFYADKLCISPRYLSTIVRSIAHSSSKEFIDRSVMLEIKMLLQSTDLSVQEIAYRLHFPDQSYLGRFFRKHAGESPTEYRNTKK